MAIPPGLRGARRVPSGQDAAQEASLIHLGVAWLRDLALQGVLRVASNPTRGGLGEACLTCEVSVSRP